MNPKLNGPSNPIRFGKRGGALVPILECLGPWERVSPRAFERWMAWMLCGDAEPEPVPFPSDWRLRFPDEGEPDGA